MKKKNEMKDPSDNDEYICPCCSTRVKHRSPYMYAPRHINRKAIIQIIDHWNIPYSTGIYILTKDYATKEEVETFVNKRVMFPWPVYKEGTLWSKEMWDD